MKPTVLRLVLLAVFAGLPCAFTLCACAPMNTNSPARLQWSFEYDVAGRVKLLRDPGGKEMAFNYETYADNPERLKSVTRRFAGGEVVQEFDPQGLLSRMKDAAGTVLYGYDDLDRLSNVQRQGTHAIKYTHDALDRITSLQVGDFYRIEYEYDFLGRLKSMKTPAGMIAYEYLTGQGEVVRSLPNGIRTFWKRQPNGQLQSITHGFFKNPKDTSYEVRAVYEYEYRPDGLIRAIGETSSQGKVARFYEYDKMGRLIGAKGPNDQQYAYEYDQLGNRFKATTEGKQGVASEFDWAGRITSFDGIECKHDAAGNLTESTIGGSLRRF